MPDMREPERERSSQREPETLQGSVWHLLTFSGPLWLSLESARALALSGLLWLSLACSLARSLALSASLMICSQGPYSAHGMLFYPGLSSTFLF